MKIGAFCYITIITFFCLIGCSDTAWETDIMETSEASEEYTNSNLVFKNEKCIVCHRKPNGIFNLLEVSCNAVSIHEEHGDGTPGGDVPNMEGFIFGENCELIEAMDECPCFTHDMVVDIIGQLVNYCSGESRTQLWFRGALVLQDMVNMECQYSSRAGAHPVMSTTTGEANACIQVIMGVVAEYEDQLNHYAPSCE